MALAADLVLRSRAYWVGWWKIPLGSQAVTIAGGGQLQKAGLRALILDCAMMLWMHG